MCSIEQHSFESVVSPKSLRRRKLWEIDGRLHCSIVGTCLSIAELKKINARLNRRIRKGVEDYDLHVDSVRMAGQPGDMSKLINKLLDRKYQKAIRRYGRAGSEEALRALWDESVADGDIPGPYWAIMSHPLASDELAARAFGSVHMLSHLVGAANRADIRRLRDLEQEAADLRDDLEKARRRSAYERSALRREVETQAERISELTQQLAATRDDSDRLETLEGALRALEDGTEIAELRRTVEALSTRLEESSARAERLAELSMQQSMRIEAQDAEAHALSDRLVEAEADRDRLEAICASRSWAPGEADSDLPSDVDLRGGTLVYVGGRARLVPYFRGLVEQANGQFVHHDGGLEESSSRLGEILSQGDVVLCPIDCVSHAACRRAKQFCKRSSKPFLPLRSAGLSSFVGGLRDAAEALGPRAL